MPTPRKHVSQLSKVTLKRNTGRYKGRQNEPKAPEVLKTVPEHLDDGKKRIWVELVSLVPAGVLRTCDTFIVELTVRLTEKMRAGGLTTTEVGQYRACLASLGITPADRSRVQVPPEPEKSLLSIILDGDREPN